MKQIRQTAGALLALCLCMTPVHALENANNHPGGPFLYPIVAQPDDAAIDLAHLYSGDTATPPPAPYDHLWRSFYDAGAKPVNWERAYATNLDEWEDFSAAYPDRNTVFSLYQASLPIPELAEQLSQGARLTNLLEQECFDSPNPTWDPSLVQGVLLNRKEDGVPMGQARLYRMPGGSEYRPGAGEHWEVNSLVSFDEMAQGRYWRESTMAVLLWSDGLKAQLDASGLDLAGATARSVLIPDYYDGILFADAKQEFFLPRQAPDFSFERTRYQPMGPKPDGAYYPAVRVPLLSSDLEPGRLYPMTAVAADLQRVAAGGFVGEWETGKMPANTGKPVIYLYPQRETDVSVQLRFDGELTYTYPRYDGGWEVTAHPDGRLTNKADGSEHYYLFWEGISDADWSFDEGFCVKGEDTEAFLRDALPKLGLLPREYNDFITYWVPKLQGNPYNLITFATSEYDALAALTVTPKPDTLVRIHMVYKPLAQPVEIAPQPLHGFTRSGFTVVEWGGTLAASGVTK